MSGHNKWSQIKHKKAASDAKKSKEFGKISRLLSVRSRETGGDRNSPLLAAAIAAARDANMPKENIERAIERGMSHNAGSLEKALYEAYGPGGSALIIDVLTDSKNRSFAEIKHMLTVSGASLAAAGAVTWSFRKSEAGWEPTTTVVLAPHDEERMRALTETLLSREDVQAVYTNASL